jgi:hypothetical protein
VGKEVIEGLNNASTGGGDVMTIGQPVGADPALSEASEQSGTRTVDISVTTPTDENKVDYRSLT